MTVSWEFLIIALLFKGEDDHLVDWNLADQLVNDLPGNGFV